MSTRTLAAEASAPPVPQRRAPRVRVTYRVRLRSGADEIVGYTTDVSMVGIFVETTAWLPVGAPVHAAFVVGRGSEEDHVEIEGRLVRRVSVEQAQASRQLPGLGIEIVRFEWGRSALLAALEKLLAAPAAGASGQVSASRRVAVGLPIYWGHAGRTELAGFLTNLSATGAFFLESRATVPAGARLHLWLELPVHGEPYPVRAVAHVVRVSEARAAGERSGMGIRFENSPIADNLLHAFLDARMAPESAELIVPSPSASPLHSPTRLLVQSAERETLDELFERALAEHERSLAALDETLPLSVTLRSAADHEPASAGVVDLETTRPSLRRPELVDLEATQTVLRRADLDLVSSSAQRWLRVGRAALALSAAAAVLILGVFALLLLAVV